MDSIDNVRESSLMCTVYTVQLQITRTSPITLKIRMMPWLKLKMKA